MRIAIVGGSIAGLASAIGLSRLPNAHIEIFERLTAASIVNGALYQIWPNGLHALQKISDRALAEVRQRAWPLERIANRSASGAILRMLQVPLQKYELPGINITRQSLIEGLRAALPQAIVIHYERAVVDVKERDDAVMLQLDGGEHSAPYDLVLIADGRTSRFRSQVTGTPSELTPHAWSAFVGQSNPYPALDRVSRGHDFHIFYGKGSVCGVCPLGDRVTWFLTFTQKVEAQVCKKLETLDAADLDTKRQFAATLTRNWFSAPEPFAAIDSADWQASSETVPVLWRMKDLDSPRRMVRGRLALVGDAGHVLLPVTGQGAAMAFEDVAALLQCLKENVPVSLRAYEAKRIPRLKQVLRLTRLEAKRSYEPDDPIRISLRTASMQLAPEAILYAALDQLIRPRAR